MSFEVPLKKQEQTEVQEKSGAVIAAERLMEKSRFKRLNRKSSNTELEIGEKHFTIESIESGDHPDIAQVQELFIKTFGEEEVDPEEVMRSAVEGKTAWDTEDITNYRLHVIKDKEGKVVSIVGGGLLDLLGDENKPTGKTMFMIGYAVTDPDARQGGLAREAYISAIMDAERTAKAQGKELSFAAGECMSTSEKFWNNVGWKRAYVADRPGETKAYTELKYVQPALDFDPETGEIAEDAGEAPEHFMVDSFGRMPPTKKEIMMTVNAFYRWCNKWPREAFENDEAYEKHLAYVQGIEDTFNEKLKQGGQVIYLDQQSQEKAMQAGVSIEEYAEADGETEDKDKEDF